MSTIDIRALLPEHWPAVKTIYEQGIATGDATFQTGAPNWDEWDRSHLDHSRLVALDGNAVAGWVALTPVSSRCVYAGVAEISIYIDPRYRGMGVGTALMQAVIADSEANGIWTLQAGIFPENTASIRLHENVGFRRVGFRERIGKMGDRWRDTIFFEKRSEKTGL
ncbi:MAG TPA: GNAT family N-acetyltransferase [Puia sp.]|nr:GNAT family N-acetyltransferase [Puia sp.]